MNTQVPKFGMAITILVAVLILAGCVHHSSYVMVLNNGMRITTAGKPKLAHGNYYYKDAAGRESFVSAGRVREVAPASMMEDDKARFKPSGVR